jgi:hypothetical protein
MEGAEERLHVGEPEAIDDVAEKDGVTCEERLRERASQVIDHGREDVSTFLQPSLKGSPGKTELCGDDVDPQRTITVGE